MLITPMSPNTIANPNAANNNTDPMLIPLNMLFKIPDSDSTSKSNS
jgi:hypothetical protein